MRARPLNEISSGQSEAFTSRATFETYIGYLWILDKPDADSDGIAFRRVKTEMRTKCARTLASLSRRVLSVINLEE